MLSTHHSQSPLNIYLLNTSQIHPLFYIFIEAVLDQSSRFRTTSQPHLLAIFTKALDLFKMHISLKTFIIFRIKLYSSAGYTRLFGIHPWLIIPTPCLRFSILVNPSVTSLEDLWNFTETFPHPLLTKFATLASKHLEFS